jgi:hypothetical protein
VARKVKHAARGPPDRLRYRQFFSDFQLLDPIGRPRLLQKQVPLTSKRQMLSEEVMQEMGYCGIYQEHLFHILFFLPFSKFSRVVVHTLWLKFEDKD